MSARGIGFKPDSLVTFLLEKINEYTLLFQAQYFYMHGGDVYIIVIYSLLFVPLLTPIESICL